MRHTERLRAHLHNGHTKMIFAAALMYGPQGVHQHSGLFCNLGLEEGPTMTFVHTVSCGRYDIGCTKMFLFRSPVYTANALLSAAADVGAL